MAYGCGYADGYVDECVIPVAPVCAPIGYGGAPFSLIVYEGYELCDNEFVITGTAPPASNVLDLETAIGRLGCGEPQFFLTSRCTNSGVFCVLDGNLISATWDRRLDDVSEAEVVMSFSGDQNYTCCECLAEAEPWCHELHIWRDGDEVWVGPVQEIEYQYDQVTLRAKDSLGWLGVRIPAIDINFTGGAANTLPNIAEFLIETALAEDSPTYTCEVDNIFKDNTAFVNTQRFYPKFDQTALEILRDLSDSGLDFTTLGRVIVLFGDTSPLTPLVLLNDSHIMGNYLIRKDGTIQGNRFYVHFDGDGGNPAVGEAVDKYCYGAIERIRSGDGLVDGASAGAVADTYVQAAAIAPRIIELPPGTRLSPDTPWTINQMVPGARVDVAITNLCLSLTQSFRLTGVEVSYSADDGESVGITLLPINSVAVAP